MSDKITVAIIGCGGRGLDAFGKPMQTTFGDRFQVVALCDIKSDTLGNAARELNISAENCFLSEDAFFEAKRADLLVIATQDRDHARHLFKGLSLGYDIMVEKPLSSDREECLNMLRAQKQSGRKVFVGHELRYAATYMKIDELLRLGEIGQLISISETEQVWYGHFVHSYVRGPWRRMEDSSPVILAKCSHDIDLIQHYAGAKCKRVSSMGDLSWFKAENAPQGAAERCYDCKYRDTCPYSAWRLYVERMKNRPDYVFSSIIVRPHKLTLERAIEAVRTGPYGRCVYHCDNDMPDNQQCLMEFENGVRATLDMNAFTGNGGRIMDFHGSLGEIILNEDEDYIRIKRYGREEHETIAISSLVSGKVTHAGGDANMLRALYDMLTGKQSDVTSLEDALESHFIGIAAEESRRMHGEIIKVH